MLCNYQSTRVPLLIIWASSPVPENITILPWKTGIALSDQTTGICVACSNKEHETLQICCGITKIDPKRITFYNEFIQHPTNVSQPQIV